MDFGLQWESLGISNDFLFAKVMRTKALCIKLLEQLLKIHIDDIVYLEEQKVINPALDAKSVRLDVYVADGKRVFDVEMQTSSDPDLAKRTRYYQGMMDMQMVEKGAAYKELKDSYIIFICTFDPFHKGYAKYAFENRCISDTDLLLGDGTQKIFFNTTAYDKADDPNVQALLKYINGGQPTNDFTETLEGKIHSAKINEDWRLEFMKLQMMQMEARLQGREEGRHEEREKANAEIKALLEFMPDDVSDEEINRRTGISLAKIKELRQ